MSAAARNIALYPWFKFFQNLLFWQATWFLFLQSELSASEAILLYAIYDIATTALEVPSGYMSDRLGRRRTLIFSAVAGLLAGGLFVFGGGLWAFAFAQVAMGAHIAFASGTDTSFLYESLIEEGREVEVETMEVRAWRFGFAALAFSAVSGGALALMGMRLPFAANALAFVVLLAITLRLAEPQRKTGRPIPGEVTHFGALRAALTHPVLTWLFAISVLMYAFSHVPFVFGQPFILASLGAWGLGGEAPLVSGAVTTLMMLLSLVTSWLAPGIRKMLGLSGILLLAFAIQIALIGGLALTGSALAIALLFLRMVPDSFSRPFILARIQPMLSDDVRATYLSLKSLVGRVLFAGSLMLASTSATGVGEMPYGEIRVILASYAIAGLAGIVILGVAASRRKIG